MSLSCNPGFGILSNICVQCSPGTYSMGGNGSCILAPIGLKIIGLPSNDTFNLVGVGSFISTFGASSYASCAYAIFEGAASCLSDEIACSPYTASNTFFASKNFSSCQIFACPNTTITASGCGTGNGDDSNDQYFSLYDATGLVVALNDDYCGSRSQLSYDVPEGAACQSYTLHQGCYNEASCFGSAVITGGGNCPRGMYFSGSNECSFAPEGYFAPVASSGVHYVCSESMHQGAATCVSSEDVNTTGSCQAGQYWHEALHRCVAVPAGYYNPTDGSSMYYFCPDPSSVEGASFCFSQAPTEYPTAAPTVSPSFSPTTLPTKKPTREPTAKPSAVPSLEPTASPSVIPTDLPTAVPTENPTAKPSARPSVSPTAKPTRAPTARPTASPSASPTTRPTAVPTVTTKPITVYPEITVRFVDGSASSSTVMIQIALNKPADYAGAVTCQPYASVLKYSPKTVAEIYTGTNKASYAQYSSSLLMTVNGLQALTQYDLFCYAANQFGYGSSLSQAISTRLSVATACCNVITYSSAPTSIIGNPAIYTGSAAGKNLFVYQLSAAPSHSLRINVKITADALGAIPTTDISSYPATGASFNSLSSGSALTAKFFISSSHVGNVYVWLNVTGDSTADYDLSLVNPFLVQLLSADGPQQAPVMLLARFSDSGTNLGVLFDISTDLAGIASTTWPCNQLFAFSGSPLVTCTWLNQSYVQMNLAMAVLGNPAVSFPGTNDIIRIRPGLLRASCLVGSVCANDLTSQQQNISIAAPLNPIKPVVSMKVTAETTRCSDLQIDLSSSSGAAGRGWSSVVWTVSTDLSHVSDANEMQSFLASVSDISEPVSVPSRLLNLTTYHISVTLTNFLGTSSSASAAVVVQSNENVPNVQITDFTSSIGPSDIFRAVGVAALSACADPNSKLTYQWSAWLDGARVPGSDGTSLDPKTLLLPPYTLTAGLTYSIVFTAIRSPSSSSSMVSQSYNSSTAVQVFVKSGAVVVAVAGGYSRSTPLDQELVIDASISYDENENPATHSVSKHSSALVFSWSCKIASLSSHYGQDCELFPTAIVASNITIRANKMVSGEQYAVTVTAAAVDGRSDFKTVTLSPSPAGSVAVLLTTSTSRINPEDKLTVVGSVTAGYSVNASWSAVFAGASLDLGPISGTKVATSFSGDEAAMSIHYPLSVIGGSLTAGRSYTFRMTSCAVDDSTKCSFGEIAIAVNSPPSGGKTRISPPRGQAFTESFTISTAGWFTSSDCYPLSYSFAYSLSSDGPDLQLKPWNPLTYIAATLPAGLAANHNRISISGLIRDIFESTVADFTNATVVDSNSPNNTATVGLTVLAKSVAAFKGTGDVTLLFQAINSVSSSLAAKDCSGATNCAALNRGICSQVANTCGSCLSGFSGVFGPSNVPCVNSTNIAARPIGALCSQNSQCLYGSCSGGLCVEPNRTCPVSPTGVPCNGQGTCSYFDPAGVSLNQCGVLHPYCEAKCVCEANYFGDDCSYSLKERTDRETVRVDMCGLLMTSSYVLDKSSALLDTFVSTLLVVFDPVDITSTDGIAQCSEVLSYSSLMASEGYLRRAKPTTASLLVQAVSLFAKTSQAALTNMSAPTAAPTSSPASPAILSAVDNIAGALGSTIANGENAVNIVGGNVQISVMKPLLSSLRNMSLSPPPSASAGSLGSPAPKIEFAGDVLSKCGFSGGYASMSLMGWSSNPFGGTEAMKSPLLSFSSAAGPSNVDSYTSKEPLYYIILPFTSQLSTHNLTDNGNPHHNRTLPECSYFDGSRYIPCRGCNISTYTNTNVTFACYELAALCGSGRRRLGLSTDDDSGAANSLATYGSLFAAIGAELASVLSMNPFTINLAKAKTALILVSCIVFTLIFGIIYFQRWDNIDHQLAAYVLASKKMRDLKKRQSEIARLKRGKKKLLRKSSSDEAFGVDETLSAGKVDSDGQDKAPMFKAFQWIKSITVHGLGGAHLSDTASDNEWADDEQEMGLLPSSRLDANCDDSYLADQWLQGNEHRFNENNNPFDVVLHNNEPVAGRMSKDVAAFRRVQRIAAKNKVDIDDRKIEKIGALEMFFSYALPSKIFKPQAKFFIRIFRAVTSFHPYVCMLGTPSCVITRTMRWLSVCRGILISLFIDTLFFGIFYPDDMTCPSLAASAATCLSVPGKIGSSSLCVWDPGNLSCTLRPPPQSFQFTIMVALLCIIINVPLDIIIGVIMDEIASHRPQLEQLGLNSNAWLGSAHTDITKVEAEVVNPKEVSMLKTWFEDANEAEEDHNASFELLPSKHNSEFNDSTPTKHKHGKLAMVPPSPRQAALAEAKLGMPAELATSVYYDFCTPPEEVNYMVHQVQHIWLNDVELSRSSSGTNIANEARREARMKAVANNLRVFPNGQPMPLASYHRLLYKDGLDKLACNIEAVRKQTDTIDEELKGMIELRMAESVEVFLIQYFVVEQVGMLQKFALRAQLFEFMNLAPFKVDAIPWILSWIFVVLSFMFFVYWIFAWGVKNSGITLFDWGVNFGIGVAQDFLVVQPMKILILFVLSVEAARPQLLSIHNTLNNVAMSMLSTEEKSKENEFRVVQHLSAACRVARRDTVAELPAAYLLRHLDDMDLLQCRQSKGWALGAIAFAIIMIPAAMALMNDAFVDSVMEVFLPSVFAGFVMINMVLLNISPALLALPYVVIVALLVYQHFVVKPSVKFVKKKNMKRSVNKHSRYSTDCPSRTSHRTRFVRWSFWLRSKWHGFVSHVTKLVVATSKPLFPRMAKQAFKGEGSIENDKTRNENIWRRMNAPATSHGVYDSKIDQFKGFESNIDVFSHSQRLERDLLVPEQIKSMTPQFNSEVALLYRDNTFFANALASVLAVDKSDPQSDENMHMVYTSNPSEQHIKMPRSVVCRSQEAFARMLLLVEEQCCTLVPDLFVSKRLGWSNDCHVKASELLAALEMFWAEFYPGGDPLNKEEIEECRNVSQMWLNENSSPFAGIPAVSLAAFEEWFVGFIDIITRLRGDPCSHSRVLEETAKNAAQDAPTVNGLILHRTGSSKLLTVSFAPDNASV